MGPFLEEARSALSSQRACWPGVEDVPGEGQTDAGEDTASAPTAPAVTEDSSGTLCVLPLQSGTPPFSRCETEAPEGSEVTANQRQLRDSSQHVQLCHLP